VTGQWFSLGTLVSSTNKTDHHYITEILLKVALNTINLNHRSECHQNIFYIMAFYFCTHFSTKQVFMNSDRIFGSVMKLMVLSNVTIYKTWEKKNYLVILFDTTFCDRVCQWLVTGQWFSLGTLVSSTNKTDHHYITFFGS
jgi:hypothetical protein